MARSSEGLSLRSVTVPRYLARLKAAGQDVRPLLEQYGLPPETPTLTDVTIPLSTLHSLPDVVAEKLGDPFLGLHLAQAMPPAAFGIIELSARSAPSLHAASQRLVRYIGLLNDLEVFSLQVDGPIATIDHRIPGVPAALGRHGNEQLISLITRVIREVLQQPWAPLRVAFAHPSPGIDLAPLRAFFGTDDIEFGLGNNALHYRASDLELPVATANSSLLELLDEQARLKLGDGAAPGDELARVRDRIRLEFQDGPPSLERVAQALKMSPRTLQRRLAGLNMSFNGLVEETRRELAKGYLGNVRLSLSEVAYLLGYADLATFIRAFKRWTGLTPKAFRDQGARA